MARMQGDQSGKSAGHKTPVPKKKLKHRFSPLNNHLTKGIQGTMYLDVEFSYTPKSSLDFVFSSQITEIFSWIIEMTLTQNPNTHFRSVPRSTLLCCPSPETNQPTPCPGLYGQNSGGDKAVVAQRWVPVPSLPPGTVPMPPLGAEEFFWHEAGIGALLTGLFRISFAKWSLWWRELRTLALCV